MKSVHKIQLEILQKLLFSESLRHSELKPGDIPNSQLKFHLDELLNEGLIEKNNNLYILTTKGKEFANRIQINTTEIRQQAKITTIMCCVREINNEKEYLIYTRLKNPFFRHQGFPTQKVWWGENITDAVKNGLKEETNLLGTPELFAIRHYRVFLNDQNQVLEDKLMHAYKFINPIGELKGNKEGKFDWIRESGIEEYITNPLPEFKEIFELLKTYSGQINFKEVDQIVEKF